VGDRQIALDVAATDRDAEDRLARASGHRHGSSEFAAIDMLG
jgi:hypothetical protein